MTGDTTRSILECVDAGAVTSTSIMVNMPGGAFALREAAHRGRHTSFGVHLNLCEGKSLTGAASLTCAGGSFPGKRRLAIQAMTGRINLEEVRGELAAQISLAVESGVSVSHLDSHKHLHHLPGIASVVADLAADFNIERIRCTLEEGIRMRGLRPMAAVSRRVRLHLARRAGRIFQLRHLRFPDRSVDLASLLGTSRREQLHRLGTTPCITELMCHPGARQSGGRHAGSHGREEQLQFLLSEDFRRLLVAAGVDRIGYWEV